MILYILLTVCALSTSVLAAEIGSEKQVPTATRKTGTVFFPHRTDLPKSAYGDPTFKMFRVLDRVKATHPRGIKGRFELSVAFIVEADGAVRETKIQKSSGSAPLDAAYLEMIRKWKFAPAELHGEPIPYQVVQPFKIEL